MQLSELGELGLLAELERRGLVEGTIDDAAHLGDGLVVTQDALVEGVHFRLDWASARDVGYKAAAVNISDLAASGAEPEALIVSLGLPARTELEFALELYEGIGEAGVPVRGGDTTRADRLYLSVTAIGRSERIPGRSGARPGDVLVVTGPLGASAAGYHALARGIVTPLAGAHHRPPLRIGEGRRLARQATAMLDLSDGLAHDAGHIAARSGCAIVIDVERVPIAEGVPDLAARLGKEVWELACGFGEDYELLAAVPPGVTQFAEIGECREGSGVELVLRGEPLDVVGWEHFG